MGVKLIMTMNDIEWGEQCLIKFGLLNDKENEIKNVSYRKVKNDESLHSAYLMIGVALDIVNTVAKHEGRTNDELTIQKLGIRLFTNGAISTQLVLSGYYQQSLSIVRDNVELLFLLGYLFSSPEHVEIWRTSSPTIRKKEFAPVKIRKILDDRDNYKSKNRNFVYSELSEIGTHVTQNGFQLYKDPSTSLITLGPFFDPKKQSVGIFSIALHQTNATKMFIKHFPSTSVDIAESIKHFNSYSELWLSSNFPKFTYADN